MFSDNDRLNPDLIAPTKWEFMERKFESANVAVLSEQSRYLAFTAFRTQSVNNRFDWTEYFFSRTGQPEAKRTMHNYGAMIEYGGEFPSRYDIAVSSDDIDAYLRDIISGKLKSSLASPLSVYFTNGQNFLANVEYTGEDLTQLYSYPTFLGKESDGRVEYPSFKVSKIDDKYVLNPGINNVDGYSLQSVKGSEQALQIVRDNQIVGLADFEVDEENDEVVAKVQSYEYDLTKQIRAAKRFDPREIMKIAGLPTEIDPDSNEVRKMDWVQIRYQIPVSFGYSGDIRQMIEFYKNAAASEHKS
jgi:hypothetical protein